MKAGMSRRRRFLWRCCGRNITELWKGGDHNGALNVELDPDLRVLRARKYSNYGSIEDEKTERIEMPGRRGAREKLAYETSYGECLLWPHRMYWPPLPL